mmetsp:Transcript_15504/g.58936  ORF Transcript_15504/g.58936 Transcript_15504/m.58936 type:complete len:91 (+) Transcript_15504:124-396(+)
MRATFLRRMGAGSHFRYPKYVDAPSGGWMFSDPPQWKRDTAICMAVGLFGMGCCYYIEPACRKDYNQAEKSVAEYRKYREETKRILDEMP